MVKLRREFREGCCVLVISAGDSVTVKVSYNENSLFLSFVIQETQGGGVTSGRTVSCGIRTFTCVSSSLSLRKPRVLVPRSPDLNLTTLEKTVL